MPEHDEQRAAEVRKKNAEYARAWRKRNPEKVKVQKRRYVQKYKERELAKILKWKTENPEKALIASRHYAITHHEQNSRAIKLEVIEAYGGKCACCGETEEAFLTIDHIFGKGREHRHRENIRGLAMYYWLKRNGFPKDAFRLLCFNCNCARGLRGSCPHEIEKVELRLVSGC